MRRVELPPTPPPNYAWSIGPIVDVFRKKTKQRLTHNEDIPRDGITNCIPRDRITDLTIRIARGMTLASESVQGRFIMVSQ